MEWYHVCWPRLTAKRVEPVVSISWASCSRSLCCCLLRPLFAYCWFTLVCVLSWLFCLICQYLPSDWLERLLWGSLIVARRSSPESPGRRVFMIFLVHCIVSFVLWCVCLVPRPYPIYFIRKYKLLCPRGTQTCALAVRTDTDRHTPMTTRPCGLRRAGNKYEG